MNYPQLDGKMSHISKNEFETFKDRCYQLKTDSVNP